MFGIDVVGELGGRQPTVRFGPRHQNHVVVSLQRHLGAPAANAAKFTVSKLDEHQNL